MIPKTVVEHDESGLEKVIDALNALREERFIEGISNKHRTLDEIEDMADIVAIYQGRVNIESRRLVKFSEHFIKEFATTNNRCFNTAEPLFKKIHSTVKALKDVFHKTMTVDRRPLPQGVEAPSVFERSSLASADYQQDLFGLESFPEAVQKLYRSIETLFTSAAQSLALCHQMLEKENETRNDPVQLRQIYQASCAELLDSVKSVAALITTKELPANELEERRKRAGSDDNEQFLKEGYHLCGKEEFSQFVIIKCVREANNNGLTDTEALFWKNDHEKGLRVRYVVEHFDELEDIEGEKDKLNSTTMVKFLKWCGLSSKDMEKKCYEEYFLPTYSAKGKLKPLGWNTISGKRKELKETWTYTDELLASEFEALCAPLFSAKESGEGQQACLRVHLD